MNFRVRVSRQAERDVDAIFDWLALRSKDGAIRWYNTYLTSLHTLPILAAGSAPAQEAETLGIDLREVFFKTRSGHKYRSLFMIDDDVIHIVGVRGAGQDCVTRDDLEIPD